MKRAIGLFIAIFGLLALVVFPAQGQEGAIVLKQKDVRSQFPDGVAFEVTAETIAPATIKEIKLEMRVNGSPVGSYAYLKLEPATTVQGKYLLPTNGAQYKPPGILLEYRFIITDSAGRTLETEKETFLYLDNRFQWEKVTAGLVEVYYYGPTQARAQLILKAGTGTVTRMGALLGITPTQTIRVIAYNNATHMAAALPFVSRATQTELLTQGQAHYEYGVLLVLAGDPQIDGIASHEITHMIFREATRGATSDLPAWLNEGMAEYANINPSSSYDTYLSAAVSANKLFRLRQLQSRPGVSQETLLMYGQGRAVVRYLVDTYGESKIKQLFTAFRQGVPIDEALKKVYGFDQDGLDNAWRKTLGLPPWEEQPTEQTPVPAAQANRWTFGCSPRR
ncbi:MAG: hypothetical protein HW402_1305 [Dehalococcoidales bacterium]|nr:hypothetical protein [Dehalococcoidales bacterium]